MLISSSFLLLVQQARVLLHYVNESPYGRFQIVGLSIPLSQLFKRNTKKALTQLLKTFPPLKKICKKKMKKKIYAVFLRGEVTTLFNMKIFDLSARSFPYLGELCVCIIEIRYTK